MRQPKRLMRRLMASNRLGHDDVRRNAKMKSHPVIMVGYDGWMLGS